ncbi:MAG: ATPase [Bacteroidia bacterium]|nr:ATPase [Bacteroidia bacterium]
MANKKLFTTDFEVHASVKMLYPYIQTAGGLSEWFADDVNISPEKVFTFVLDGNDARKAKMVSSRVNHFCRFEFLPESDDDRTDPSWFELRLETNELTQTTFIKVSDYSDFDDLDELQDLWEGLIENLKKVVGG